MITMTPGRLTAHQDTQEARWRRDEEESMRRQEHIDSLARNRLCAIRDVRSEVIHELRRDRETMMQLIIHCAAMLDDPLPCGDMSSVGRQELHDHLIARNIRKLLEEHCQKVEAVNYVEDIRRK